MIIITPIKFSTNFFCFSQSCSRTCEANRPCCAPGCPNAPRPYYFGGPFPSFFGPYSHYRPNFQGPNSFYGRWNSGPNFSYRPITTQPDPDSSNGTVRIGVGNRSETDINVDVYDNLVTGGRQRVHLGSGNYAGRSNTGVITNNKADADDLMIGADNVSGGDNNIRVRNNDFSGSQRVRVGSGNYARGSNRIVVDGGFGSSNGGSAEMVGRRRSWLWW